MNHTHVDGSSSELTLRCYAPPVLSVPYQRSNSPSATQAMRLGRRLAFVETLLRHSVALFSAEADAHGIERGPRLRELLRRLERPTLGLWAHAAVELAQQVTALDAPITADMAAIFIVSDDEPASLDRRRALDRLIDERNARAHDDDGFTPTETQASQILSEIEPDLRTLFSSLRPLRRHPIFVATQVRTLIDGSQQASILRLRGDEPDDRGTVAILDTLPDKTPFLLAHDGRVLLLAPMLQWREFVSRRDPELRLFRKWTRTGTEYSDPRGETEATLQETQPSPQDWLDHYHQRCLLSGVFPEDDVRRLRDDGFGTDPPRLPGFTIGARIGVGASGSVYAARSDSDDAPVAIKVLNPVIATDPTQRERLRREYTVMATLRHPNIAQVYEFIDDPQRGPVLVMEFVPGTNLQRVARDQALPPERAVGLCVDVLNALEKAHTSGVIHRDIKPSNAILGADGRVRLLDFGIARTAQPSQLTQTMDVFGTTQFSAPEQLNNGQVDARSDLFGVGRLLGFLASASVDPTAHLQALPSALQAVYSQATRTDPAERFSDAAAMRQALLQAATTGFEGAPLLLGTTLHGAAKIEQIVQRFDPGIWLLTGRDVIMDVPIALLVADRDPDASTWLQRLLRALPDGRKRALGHPRAQKTADGLWYCVIMGEKPSELALRVFQPQSPPDTGISPELATATAVGGGLLAATLAATGLAGAAHGARKNRARRQRDGKAPARHAAALATGVGAFGALAAGAPALALGLVGAGLGAISESRKPMTRLPLPDYLAGWPTAAPSSSATQLAQRASQLGLLIHMQASVVDGRPMDRNAWARLGEHPLRPALRVMFEHGAEWSPKVTDAIAIIKDRPARSHALTELVQALQNSPDRPMPADHRKHVIRSLEALFSIALQLGQDLPEHDMFPYVVDQGDGRWHILQTPLDGPERYAVLGQ